jgi:hypothetical protein
MAHEVCLSLDSQPETMCMQNLNKDNKCHMVKRLEIQKVIARYFRWNLTVAHDTVTWSSSFCTFDPLPFSTFFYTLGG